VQVATALHHNAQVTPDAITQQLLLRLAALQSPQESTSWSADVSGADNFTVGAFLSALKASTSAEESRVLLRRAEDLCLASEDVYLAAIWSCSKLGAYEEAFELLERILEANPAQSPVEDVFRALFALHDKTIGDLRGQILHRMSHFTTMCGTTCSAKMTKVVASLCERNHSMTALYRQLYILGHITHWESARTRPASHTLLRPAYHTLHASRVLSGGKKRRS